MHGAASLIGRAHELDRLDVALRDVAEGHGSTLLVTGDAGIGKSALLASLRTRAAAAGLRVKHATALEFERGMPLRVFHELLGAGWRTGSDLDASPQAPSLLGAAPTIPERLLDLLVEEVERVGSEPSVLVIDDVQWADRWSVQAVLRVARLSADLPLLLAIAVRTPTADRDLAALLEGLGRVGAQRLTLGPLSAVDSDRWAELVLGPATVHFEAVTVGGDEVATATVDGTVRAVLEVSRPVEVRATGSPCTEVTRSDSGSWISERTYSAGRKATPMPMVTMCRRVSRLVPS